MASGEIEITIEDYEESANEENQKDSKWSKEVRE